ncbi:MAG: tetratricopeptide repeat protein [Acidimicrobiia bacterium]|nr:tetratricopeptide repeat protein [Acidimicrobiia bacterium]
MVPTWPSRPASEQLSQSNEALLAIRIYDAVLEREPENVTALTYRGWLVHQAELDEEALTYLDRALAVDPDFPAALVFRAVVLRDLGRTDEAREALAAFDTTDPPEQMSQLVESLGLRESLQ